MQAMTYGEDMGQLFGILLIAIVVIMIVSAAVSALHYLFWIAVLGLLVVAAVRLTASLRRGSRR